MSARFRPAWTMLFAAVRGSRPITRRRVFNCSADKLIGGCGGSSAPYVQGSPKWSLP
ncbi:hypothetical protein FGF82_23895 [Salmonella sp. gx-f9]|nr:hypothetical protein [Salmonella sp. gx-f9]HBI19703.1 hypothetical protein [Brevundimonas sp.]